MTKIEILIVPEMFCDQLNFISKYLKPKEGFYKSLQYYCILGPAVLDLKIR